MRALLISYAFPPVGGAGVQRMSKLAKYLPEHGVTPRVLTALNPSVPVLDPSLLKELPSSVAIERARTLEPGYAAKAAAWRAEAGGQVTLSARATRLAAHLLKAALVPDPQVLWLPGAAQALSRMLLPRSDVDVVLASGPPFSSHALGLLTRLRPGVGVVLDYRDEWTTARRVYEMAGSSLVDGALETACLRMAHAVTTATEEFRTQLLDRFAFLRERDVTTIENGFDPADMPAGEPERPRDRLVVTYTGTVFRLTSAAGLMEGLRRLSTRVPDLAKRLEVRFVGRIVDTEERWFRGSEAFGVRRVGYLEHARALDELFASHVALCLLDEQEGAERIYPAKIFEVMGLRRPCLAVCPEGALARLVREQRLGEVVPPRDPERIALAFESLLARFFAGRLPQSTDPPDLERFDRRRQAARFARVLADAGRRAKQGASAALAGARV